MSWLEFFKTWEVIAGLTAAVFTAASWLVVRWDTRQQRLARDAKEEVLAEQRNVETRVSALETRVGEVEQDLEHIGEKVTTIDRDMQKVATSEAVAQLRVEMAGMAASLRATSGMVDTIYRAATHAGVD